MQGLGLDSNDMYNTMSTLNQTEKVKVLLARALFGQPDMILLDEPTNGLDAKAITWLEDFLIEYEGTVIVVSHDRHFLNNVCTHIVDVDYGKIKMYVGNYDFWYESSQLMQRMMRDQNRKAEEKIKELQNFIQRFSANKSKSRQATSRKKLLDKITVEEMPASSRRYPYVGFTMDRELGKDVLTVSGLTKTVDGVKVLDNVTFTVGRTDKIAFTASNEFAVPTLFKILMGELEPDAGTFKWAFRRVSPISRRIIPPISPIRKILSSAGSSNIPKTPPKRICAVSSAKCCSPAKTSISPCRCFPAAKRCAACSRA